MNDRFKFRVWNKKYNFYDFCRRKFGILYIQEKFRVSSGYDGEDKPTFCEDVNENYIIEQCTGLKDKNGNLIYEGDVVKIGNGSVNGEVIESEIEVEWVDNAGRYNLPTWASDVPDWSHYIEIIGNIHEQAEQKD